RLLLRLKTEDRGNGAERFLFSDTHSLRCAAQNRRLEKGAAERMALAAEKKLRAFTQRILDMRLDLLNRLFGDQRALRDPLLQPIADFKRLRPLGQLCDEGVMDASLHINPVGADAGLPGIAVFRGNRRLHRLVQIGVIEDEEGRVAAKLE